MERRAEVFGDFLRTIEKCREEASKYFRESPEPGIERTQKLLDIYEPAFVYAKITRLFMSKDSREPFKKLVNEIYALHACKELGDTRFKALVEKLGKIQKILEENLQKPTW